MSLPLTILMWTVIQVEFSVGGGMGMSSCTDNDQVGVSRPWEYRYGSDIRISENRWYLMLGGEYQVTCCGYVIGWEFQASMRAQVRPIEFQIWRPINERPSAFTLIGQHHFWYMRERSRTVSVALQSQDFSLVRPGDVIGWHTPFGDIVDYKTTNHETPSKYYIIPDMKNVTIGQSYTFTGPRRPGRIYGIKAILAPVQTPKFINLPRKVTLKCPMDANQTVTTIEITSSREGRKVKYSIDGYSPWFVVHEHSGEVRTIAPLHGNMTSDVTIIAASTCDVYASSVLTLQCIDISETTEAKRNDQKTNLATTSEPLLSVNAPVYHVSFRESVTSETTLRVINASTSCDEDAICTISRTQPHVSAAVLYSSGNKLLMRSNYTLLHNTTQLVNVGLTCILTGGRTYEELVVIHIIKDLEPVFDNLPALVRVSARQARVSDVIFEVNATDKEGQMLTFDVSSCSCPFTVKKDGSVAVASDLRMTTQTSFSLDVFVTDGFNRVGPATLAVVITDPNHAPQFVQLPHEVVVPENSHGVILTIQSHDPDDQDNVTLTWAWEDVDAVRFFTFNESYKQLYVTSDKSLDYEYVLKTLNQTSFALLLTLSDGALSSDTERVLVHISDVNEKPRFSVKRMNVTCNEGKAGTVLLSGEIRQMATDPDIHDLLVFQLLPGNLSDMFSLDRITGQLTYASDYDTDPSRLPDEVILQIQVSDIGNLTDVMEVRLFVKNVNRPPVVTAPSSVAVGEDTPGGSLLFSISASDWDTMDILNITIICTDRSDRIFKFTDSGTVKLKENSSLDYEMISMYTFQVQADDGHMTSEAVFVLLYVLDVNESPFSTQDNLFISASEGKAGDVVSRVELGDIFTDPDHDPLTFRLLQRNDSDWSSFVIDTASGWLYMAHDIDVTRGTSPLVLIVYVVAEDPGKLSGQVKIEVALNFVNTRPTLPGLPAQITVWENMALNGIIFTVTADDDDGDNVTLRFHMMGDEATRSFVSINILTGEVTLSTRPVLGQGQTTELSLVVSAFDGEETSDPGILNITIAGVNDPPQFPKDEYRFSINETQVGQYVFEPWKWSDLDPDPGDNMTFLIIGGKSEEHITVSMATGQMKVKDDYDIDVVGNPSNLTAILMVTDSFGLNATTTVFIMIEDVNDNAPVVENDEETFLLVSDVTSGSRVGQIQATDRDSGKNGALTFNLLGSTLNDTSVYFIVSKDGWILSTGLIPPLDHITIYVGISDKGWPSNIAMATIYVIVVKSTNETGSQHSLHQPTSSAVNGSAQTANRGPAILILIGLVACCCAVIMVLGYQLWKAKKVQRSTQPEQCHDAYHEYRFPWVPRQIIDEEGSGTRHSRSSLNALHNSRSSLNATPSFFGTCVSNENFQYMPGIQSSPQHKDGDECQEHRKMQDRPPLLGRENNGQNSSAFRTEKGDSNGKALPCDAAWENFLVKDTQVVSGNPSNHWQEGNGDRNLRQTHLMSVQSEHPEWSTSLSSCSEIQEDRTIFLCPDNNIMDSWESQDKSHVCVSESEAVSKAESMVRCAEHKESESDRALVNEEFKNDATGQTFHQGSFKNSENFCTHRQPWPQTSAVVADPQNAEDALAEEVEAVPRIGLIPQQVVKFDVEESTTQF